MAVVNGSPNRIPANAQFIEAVLCGHQGDEADNEEINFEQRSFSMSLMKRRESHKVINMTASSISPNNSMISAVSASKVTTLSACAIMTMVSVMWVCTDTSYSFVYLNITNV